MLELNKCDSVSLEIWRNAYAVSMGALIAKHDDPFDYAAVHTIKNVASDYADGAVHQYNNQLYPEKADD